MKKGSLGPYSKALTRGAVGVAIDGRSREGKFLRTYERLLTEHVGGKPTITQRLLIQRAARMALHLELLDETALAAGHVFSTHDHNFYIAWTNSLSRLLGRLGIDPADKPAARAPAIMRALRETEAA